MNFRNFVLFASLPWLVIAGVLSSAPLRAQFTVHQTLSIPPALPSGNNRAGTAFAALGDVNGDGHDDYAVGSPSGTIGIGRVRVVSGLTGGTIWDLAGPNSARSYGFALTRIPDLNADQVDDLGVGAPDTDLYSLNGGAAYVVSGANGAILRTFGWNTAGEHFGFSIASVKIPSWANPLLVVGIPDRTFSRGGFNAYDAVTGALWSSYTSLVNGDLACFSLASAGDFNGDFHDDVIVGIPQRLNADGGIGEARIVSLAPGTLGSIATISGGAGTTAFGSSVDGGGNINGDGFSDVIVGAPAYDSGGGNNNGRVQSFSGPLGSPFLTYFGQSLAQCGKDVAFIGDLDGDGFTDLTYGIPSTAAAGAPTPRIAVRSGHTGESIGSFIDSFGQAGFGSTVAAAGDPNRDGHADILIGNGDENIALLVGVNSLFVGSREDLVLRTSYDNSLPKSFPETYYFDNPSVGESLRIELQSPEGTYVGAFPFLIGYLRPTGAQNATLAGFPEVHIDPTSYFFLFDAGVAGVFGPAILPENGIQVSGLVPAGLTGLSMVLQGAVLAPAPYLGNPAFTLTNAVEYRFL